MVLAGSIAFYLPLGGQRVLAQCGVGAWLFFHLAMWAACLLGRAVGVCPMRAISNVWVWGGCLVLALHGAIVAVRLRFFLCVARRRAFFQFFSGR